MVAPTSDKEERRRRMAEKGLNRMSQIRSARPQTPPPSSTHANDSHSGGARDRKAIFSDDDQAPQTNQSRNINAGPVGQSEASSNIKQGDKHEISSVNSLDVRGQSELSNKGTGKHSTYAHVVDEKDKSQPEISSIGKASTNAESVQKTSRNQSNIFSSMRLNSYIIASEKTRGVCALAIAFCVLLSHISLPLFGFSIGTSDSNVASKPLYIILLTDFTVILARLFLGKKGGGGGGVSREVEEEKPAAPQDNKENWDGTVMLLERGLVAYQTIRAIFIDFSIYAVVVICGTSLL